MSNARFNKAFKPVNDCRSRYRVILGSAGSGKSVNTAQDYILKLSDHAYKGCSLLVVRSSESSHINSTYAELYSAIAKLGLLSIWETKVSPLSMRCRLTGNSIIFRGCSDQRALERLKSINVPEGKLCWIWVEEATELRYTDYEQLDNRLRGKLPSNLYYQITLTFNPINSGHWIKSKLWDLDNSDIFKHKSTYLDNTFCDEAYYKRMELMQIQNPEGFEVYGLGNWGETGGLIFTNITIGDYSRKQFEQFTIGTDFGFSHKTAVTLFGWYDGSPYALKEVVCTGKTTAEIIDLCNKAQIPKSVRMYCDSAEPDRIKEFRNAGFKALPVTKGAKSVQNQIAWLQNRTIFIDGRCINMHKEIQAYKYLKDKTTGLYTDEPVTFDDDSIASLRYGIEPYLNRNGIRTMSKGVLGL